MFLNEDVNRERHKDLLREAQQERLAHERMTPYAISLTQRTGYALLKLGARFIAEDAPICYIVEARGQVSVCRS